MRKVLILIAIVAIILAACQNGAPGGMTTGSFRTTDPVTGKQLEGCFAYDPQTGRNQAVTWPEGQAPSAQCAQASAAPTSAPAAATPTAKPAATTAPAVASTPTPAAPVPARTPSLLPPGAVADAPRWFTCDPSISVLEVTKPIAWQSGKSNTCSVQVNIPSGMALFVDGYIVNGENGVFQVWKGPASVDLAFHDGAFRVSSVDAVHNMYCAKLRDANSRGELIALDRPLPEWGSEPCANR